MCTIGGIVKNRRLILFKNCDLARKARIFKPRLFRGKYRYVGFTRKNRPGVWAGMNELGLGIVAADAHTKKKYKARPHMINRIFKAYKDVVANCANADEAKNFLKNFYQKNISVPDLVVVGDRKKLCVIEFAPPKKWKVRCVKSGFIARSNHFLLLEGALPGDVSSYLRYETARRMLRTDSSLNGIKRLCGNHDNGPGENSICRHGKKYKTRASAIMVSGNKGVTAYHIINNSPCQKRYEALGLKT